MLGEDEELDAFDLLFGVLDELGIRWGWADWLPESWWGAYPHEHQMILLQGGYELAPKQVMLTMFHELAHAICGHRGHGIPEQEELAREFAARSLVDPSDYYAGVAHGLSNADIADRQGLCEQTVADYGRYVMVSAAAA